MEFDLKHTLQELQFVLSGVSSDVNRKRLTVLRGKESCRSNCSGCCRRLVHITVGHAILIHARLEKSGDWENVRESCLTLVPLLKNSSPISWFRMNIPCPLLTGDQCSIYDIRPPSCSTHLVSSDAKLCDPWTAESGNYTPIDMNSEREAAEERIDRVFSSRGILGRRLPIPSALLFADRVRRVRHATPEMLHRIFVEEFR